MLTQAEFVELNRKIDIYENARYNVCGTRLCLTQDDLKNILLRSGLTEAPTNTERGLVEQYKFLTEKPEKYFAYYNENTKEITTWMGDRLGGVIWLGSQYTCPSMRGIPSCRQNFTMTADNGEVYSGTYFKSSGDYVRMKLVKSRKRRASSMK